MIKKNGLLRTLTIIGVSIGIATGAAALVTTYIVGPVIGPVKSTADEAKAKAESNREKIHAIEVDVAEIRKDTEDIPDLKRDIERFMRTVGVPPTSDVPAGEHPADE